MWASSGSSVFFALGDEFLAGALGGAAFAHILFAVNQAGGDVLSGFKVDPLVIVIRVLAVEAEDGWCFRHSLF